MALWYRSGVINVTQGSPVVTGSGTAWSGANTHPGDVLIAPDGNLYEITSVDSPTQLQIKPVNSSAVGYQGVTDTSGTAKYAIAPLIGSTTTADLAQRIAKLLTSWQDRQDELSNWQGGTATGGTNGDGKYPLTDSLGRTSLIVCPAKLSSTLDQLEAAYAQAQAQANAASTSATNAATSATNAATSATQAANSKTAAATSEANALSSKNAAATSATNAATSATTASTRASEASTSATNAAASAASALTYKNDAAASATAAQNAVVGLAPLDSPTFQNNATAPKFTSTATTGTAPLTVSSTTAVTNLNADMVDGFHASQAAVANQIPVMTNNNVLVLGGGADNGVGVDKIVARNGGIFMVHGDSTNPPQASKAAISLLNSYAGAFGYSSAVKFGVGTTMNDFGQLAAIAGIYDGYSATNGIGGRLAFYTKNAATDAAPVERMRISGNGNVVIGSTSDNGVDRFQVAGSMVASQASNYSAIYVKRTDQSSVGQTDQSLIDVMTATGAARLVQLQGGVTKNELRLYPSGNVVFGLNGDVMLGTATWINNAGKLQLAGGITFPVVQAASTNANTLDDYEEGTWTPVLVADTTAGAGTYTMQEGSYTKVGRLVHVRCRLQWSAHTGVGTYMYINGLPYGCVNASALSVWASNVVVGAGKQLTAYASSGLTRITLATIDLAGGAIGNLAFDTAGDVFISGTYETTT